MRNIVHDASDPVSIESTQRQIKTIERLQEEIQKSLHNREYSVEASKIIESMFVLSDVSHAQINQSAASSKRRKMKHQGDQKEIIQASFNKELITTTDDDFETMRRH